MNKAMEYERDLQEYMSILIEQLETADEGERVQLKIALKVAMNKWITQHEEVCHLLILTLKELEESPKRQRKRVAEPNTLLSSRYSI
jgi:hypothetical protein